LLQAAAAAAVVTLWVVIPVVLVRMTKKVMDAEPGLVVRGSVRC
jgi:hypothetical protein